MSVKWTGDLQMKLAQMDRRATSLLVRVTQYYSLMGEANLKKKARWTDRSSNARNGLTATYQATKGTGGGSTFSIEMYHTVPYGFWLETRNFSRKGRLAVIKPTIDYIGPKFFVAAGKVIGRSYS